MKQNWIVQYQRWMVILSLIILAVLVVDGYLFFKYPLIILKLVGLITFAWASLTLVSFLILLAVLLMNGQRRRS